MQEELSHIVKAEFVAQAPQDDKQHDIGGELEVIEEGASAFVKAALAGPAGEGLLAQRGSPFSAGQGGRLTMRAEHGRGSSARFARW